MDKNAIKKYAVWARRELISRVSQRAAQYEITADGYGDQNAASVHGRVLSPEEKKQRTALIAQIREKGYEQVMEEIAYTWFNRFSALRFMEVNGYLPSRVRVFTDDENKFRPQILAEAINMELDGLDMQKVYELKNANDDDALFKYMIIVQCNALSGILPGMFQRISDYTELLFPDNLLREGSVIEQMISMIPQEDWTDQVQIIGWLYQYYNTEPKDQVFANLKKNIKITKENIPAATQLFTPDWIVRYMVENSLGRLWLEGHPNDELKAGWKYYLDEAEQEPEVQTQLAEIRKEYAALKPEDILAIDPCQGSGHILAYMFDVLVQIYEAYGYSAREAAASIVEHNIWGLDIDERAAQLAYFSVMMKARQYDRRFFSRGIQPHVYAILESNGLDRHCIEYFVDGRKELKSAMDTLVEELRDAKEYGSILNVTQVDFDALYARFEEIRNEDEPGIYSYQTLDALLPFVQVAQAMAQKYHAVVTNPPYMGASGMGTKLSIFVKDHYPDSKSDMSTVCMERCMYMCSDCGFTGMINIPVWMFLSSYEKLRYKQLKNYTYVNMVHPGRGIFGSDFGTTTFTIAKQHIHGYASSYRRLFDKQGEVETVEVRKQQFFSNKGSFTAKQDDFSKIPGVPVAYWVSDSAINDFAIATRLSEKCETRKGLATSDNNRFLKLWYEVAFPNIGFGMTCNADTINNGIKWYPENKGGEFRRWYGNRDYIINWENDGYSIRNFKDEKGKLLSRPQNTNYNFLQALTWSKITISMFSARFCEGGFLFDDAAAICHHKDTKLLKNVLGFLNSKCCQFFLSMLNPTINIQIGDIGNLPILEISDQRVGELVDSCLSTSRIDWDSFETSWDFQRHPLVIPAVERGYMRLSDCYKEWARACDERFAQLKANEEELNRIFIDIYGFQDELTPEVPAKDVTVRRADLGRDIRSLISYAVGCMFGRYSLDTPGLVYAGGAWDASRYATFQPDKDAILPICDDEYFEDDIVGRFVKFIETVYGKATLEENLRFIADALGTGRSGPSKGSARDVIRGYFLGDFYADHLKVYQKRPIYWLFDSGKKNGFKCLVYMHRYQPDTIARIRTDYVHEQQSRYRTAIADLESRIAGAGTGERVKLTKRLDVLRAQAEELRVYEEKIHHLADQMIKIDLDDGVKVNYAKFQDVLAKIK